MSSPKTKPIPRKLFPWPCGGTSSGVVFSNGPKGAIVYECWPNGEFDGRIDFAVLRIDDGLSVSVGSPNDEAQQNHPVQEINHCKESFIEVLNSHWLKDRFCQAHKLMLISPKTSHKHFVFFFKENTIELFARGFTHIGTYKSKSEAYSIAAESIE